ncbi:nitrate reductase cytochrome c-type subunit [Thiohalobacter sp. IOR34]|uniref:nitrate reductase cytochrome c-type subunit n=1 Tax=Thiohalobacter sp. IOR34 TaxID=3057176 RepID=UPI0025B0EE04|nr:nitrate reductase cytochrome c-type subunit [Thiohalobacter sp. IOR34]WJW75358.1 nitrate reductase cytochrome c-type subunit [Thiohalobacter sp. IOR34]
MKKSIVTALGLALALGGYASLAVSELASLRGAQDLTEESKVPAMKQYRKDGEVFDREYVQQPPLIPHKIEGYQINRKFNKCLSCHSWANYKEAGATKISQTHFEDRDKNVLANVSARRYFCTQCHVPQVNAKPLVDNTFEPVRALTGH